MIKKIIYAAIAIAVVVAGYIGVNRLGYWERSIRIFSFDSNQAFGGRGGRGLEGRARFEGRGERPQFDGNLNIPDSLRQRNFRNFQGQPPQGPDGRVQNFEGRPERGEFEGGGRGGERGGFPGAKKVNLRNVWWFLAVFAAFTAVTIYADKAYCLIKKRIKGNA